MDPALEAEGPTAADPWSQELERLQERFPNTKKTVLFAVHVLQGYPDIALPDLVARARLHGFEIDGRTLSSAQRLLGLRPPRQRRQPRREEPNGGGPSWPAVRADLEREFPDTREGIRFCIHKLRQDPGLSLPDIRAEALEHGVKLGGRSLHSARKLLEPEPEPEPVPASRRVAAGDSLSDTLEEQLRSVLRRAQGVAEEDTRRLRAAMQKAIEVLQTALDDDN